MPNYQTQHPYYCGVDLHARSLFINICDPAGTTKLEQNLPAQPAAFLDAIKPFPGFVVGCECMFACVSPNAWGGGIRDGLTESMEREKPARRSVHAFSRSPISNGVPVKYPDASEAFL